MAQDKKSFLLYCDIIHTVNKLPDEKAGKLLKHILAYVNDQNPETDDVLIDIAFEPIKQSLKRDLKKYENKCAQNTDNIRKRWDKKNTNVYDRIRPDTNHTDSDRDSDIERDIDKGIEKERIPPTPRADNHDILIDDLDPDIADNLAIGAKVDGLLDYYLRRYREANDRDYTVARFDELTFKQMLKHNKYSRLKTLIDNYISIGGTDHTIDEFGKNVADSFKRLKKRPGVVSGESKMFSIKEGDE